MTDTVNNNNQIGGFGPEYDDQLNSRFNWNRKRKKQKLLKKRKKITVKPKSVDPYIFNIPASEKRWSDLPTTIVHGMVRVRHEDGAAPQPTENWSVVNCFYHALWRQVGIAINGKMFEDSSTRVYGHKAFMNILLNFKQRFKDTVLSANNAWKLDTGNSTSLTEYEDVTGEEDEEEVQTKVGNGAKETVKIFRPKRRKVIGFNSGYVDRRNGLKTGDWVEFHIPLHHDLCTTESVWPPNTRFDIVLHRSDDKFCLIQPNETIKYKIELENVHLTMYQLDASEAVNNFHKSIPNPTTFIRRNELKYYVAEKDKIDIGVSGICSGQLPEQIYVTFIDQNAFYGTATTNPFNLEFMDFDEASLVVDGENFPAKPYVTGKDMGKLDAYMEFLYSTGTAHMSTDSVPVSLEMWQRNCFILAFDRSPDGQNSYYAYEPDYGSIDLNLKLTRVLGKNYIVFVYASYQQELTQEGDEFKIVKKSGF